MKRLLVVALLLMVSLSLPGRAPGVSRADNTAFRDLLTTINNSGPELTALQALAPSCTPGDPCLPAEGVTLVDAGTLAGFKQTSFDNTVLHRASSILALRGVLSALSVGLDFCDLSPCSESLTSYLASQGVAPATVVAVVGVPPNPIRIYFTPIDPCVPQLTVAACKE